MTAPEYVALLGTALITAGVAVLFWPAALMVAGAFLIAFSYVALSNPEPEKITEDNKQ